MDFIDTSTLPCILCNMKILLKVRKINNGPISFLSNWIFKDVILCNKNLSLLILKYVCFSDKFILVLVNNTLKRFWRLTWQLWYYVSQKKTSKRKWFIYKDVGWIILISLLILSQLAGWLLSSADNLGPNHRHSCWHRVFYGVQSWSRVMEWSHILDSTP